MTNDQIFVLGVISFVVSLIYLRLHEEIPKVINLLPKPLQKIVFLMFLVCGLYACGNGLYHISETGSMIMAIMETNTISGMIWKSPITWPTALFIILWPSLSIMAGGVTAFMAGVEIYVSDCWFSFPYVSKYWASSTKISKANQFYDRENYETAAKEYMGVILNKNYGSTNAMINLSGMFKSGKGVSIDQQHSIWLLHCAGYNGNSTAQKMLAKIRLTGDGFPKSKFYALVWSIIYDHNEGTVTANKLMQNMTVSESRRAAEVANEWEGLDYNCEKKIRKTWDFMKQYVKS
jgi:hypothetical protein